MKVTTQGAMDDAVTSEGATPSEEGGTWRRTRSESYWRSSWRMLQRNPMAMVGLVGLLLLALVSTLAPWVAPHDPTEIDRNHILEPPNASRPFGSDDLGRDVLSRVIWGGRESLRVGFLSIVIAMSGGVVVGLLSGYLGGFADTLIQRLVEIAMAFPTILLLLSIVAVLGPNLGTAMIAIGFSWIPHYSRLVRGSVLTTKNLEYVTAAKVIGVPKRRIMFRHILPNIIAPVIVYSTVGIGTSILLTAGLSYIGLGAQPPSPEWGAMLLYGRNYLRQAWWMSVFPGIAIFLSVLFINLLGDGLRDALDPKLRI